MFSVLFGKLTYGYRTNAEVLVAHRGLGCLRVVLYLCIVAYILVSMLVLKRFAVFEIPTIRVQTWTNNEGVSYIRPNVYRPYCDPAVTTFYNLTLPGSFNFANFKCVERDVALLSSTAPNYVGVATFLFEQDKYKGVSVSDMRSTFFVDAELATVNFEVMYSASWTKQGQFPQVVRLQDAAGNVIASASDSTFLGLRFKDLLDAAGLKLDEVNVQGWVEAVNTKVAQVTPLFRMTGVELIVTATFKNTDYYSPSILPVECILTVSWIPRIWAQSSAQVLEYQSYPHNYTIGVKDSINARFVVGGLLGRFDLSTLFLNLISFLVLFGAVPAVVDAAARACLTGKMHSDFVNAKDSVALLDITGNREITVDSGVELAGVPATRSPTFDGQQDGRRLRFQDLEQQVISGNLHVV